MCVCVRAYVCVFVRAFVCVFVYVCLHFLQRTIDEMQHQEVDFQAQMKEQCEDYKELLSEKMARDMEIAAYRSGWSAVFVCLFV